jgi:hypothetical protein
MKKKILSVSELVAVMSVAKANGRYVTITASSEVKLNKFPTDGSERIRIDADFKPRHEFVVKFHFGADYEKAMTRALGLGKDYNASDKNRVHIVKNVLMQYVSTGTTCMIYMPESYVEGGYTLNGKPLTAEQSAYLARYKSKSSSESSAVEYRTIAVRNISRIAINNEVYELAIYNEVEQAG